MKRSARAVLARDLLELRLEGMAGEAVVSALVPLTLGEPASVV